MRSWLQMVTDAGALEEMRANGNEFAAISHDHPEQVWQALMTRLGGVPEYRRLFEMAYPGQRFQSMTFAHASNAIAGFLISDLAFNNPPWDRARNLQRIVPGRVPSGLTVDGGLGGS